MSQVTMCDWCGSTTRQTAEIVKFKLPKAVLPEVLLEAMGAGISEAPFDACRACASEIADLFDGLITRRLGGGEPATEGER